MIILPIKKQWFDMILTGKKKEEYRSIKPYYTTRFKDVLENKNVFKCILRNGYSKNSPSITITSTITIGFGKPEWGANENEQCYILSIIDVEK